MGEQSAEGRAGEAGFWLDAAGEGVYHVVRLSLTPRGPRPEEAALAAAAAGPGRLDGRREVEEGRLGHLEGLAGLLFARRRRVPSP